MSIGLFGQTWVPSTDDATSPNLSTGAIHAITPPSSMVSGQVVLLLVTVRGSGTYTPVISQAGGQTWTAYATQNPTTDVYVRLFSCIFNGTWSADPSVDFGGTTGTYPICLWLGAFDGVDTGDIWDVEPTATAYASGKTTLPAITTGVDNALALHLWGEGDDNTAIMNLTAVDSRKFSAPDGNIGALHSYVGNIAGSDCGLMVFSRSLIKAGSAGTPTVTMGTSDPGYGYIASLKSAAKAIYPVNIGAYLLASSGTSHAVAVPTVAEGDLMLCFLARTSGNLPNSIPSGWSLVDSEVNGNNSYLVYKKVASGSEPATYTWSGVNSCKHLGYIVAFDGTAGTPEVETSDTVTYGVQTSTLVVPSLTPAGSALSVIFAVGEAALDRSLWHPQAYSRWDFNGDNAADFWGGPFSKWVSAATGTQTFTPSSAADTAGAVHVLLKAAGAAATSKAYYNRMNTAAL